jgi:NAD(P)-dependent dehydrogenase (short-subunit alcohol dehydrogenase family)
MRSRSIKSHLFNLRTFHCAIECLALELAEHNINVNAICSGAVDTKVARWEYVRYPEIGLGRSKKGLQERFLSQIPLKRYARPEEIAALAAFLASDEANYITGATFGITGGTVMW